MAGTFGQTVVTAGAVGFAVFFVVVTASAGVLVFMFVVMAAAAGVFMFMFVCVVVTASAGVLVFVFVVVTATTGVFVFSHFLLPFLSLFSFGFGLIFRFGVQLNPDLPFLVAGAHNETIFGRSLHRFGKCRCVKGDKHCPGAFLVFCVDRFEVCCFRFHISHDAALVGLSGGDDLGGSGAGVVFSFHLVGQSFAAQLGTGVTGGGGVVKGALGAAGGESAEQSDVFDLNTAVELGNHSAEKFLHPGLVLKFFGKENIVDLFLCGHFDNGTFKEVGQKSPGTAACGKSVEVNHGVVVKNTSCNHGIGGGGQLFVILFGVHHPVSDLPGGVNDVGITCEQITVISGSEGGLDLSEFFRAIYQISGIWETAGYDSIVFFAAIIAISPTSYEAAQIDGAGKMAQMRYVVLPSILSTIVIMLINRIGSLLNVGYEKVLLLYNPDTYVTAEVVSAYANRIGLEGKGVSIASAAEMLNNVVGMLLVIGANTIARKASDVSLY